MSSSIPAVLQPTLDARQLAGAVAVAVAWSADGRFETCALGWQDEAAGRPMQRDTLFRIASMTKPITSVAALMLVEQGTIALSDPITRFAPELANLRVLRSPTGPLEQTDPASRAITFEDLLTHRSGLTYGSFHAGPIAQAYAALGGDIDSPLSPSEWIATLASLPLIGQPGATFHYSHSTDLLGLIIARIEDRPLGEVLARRIFEPLGMESTGFVVPKAERHRRAALYGFDSAGAIVAKATGPGGSTVPERPDDMQFESGGQGLWSTADDYLRFARLFVQEGEVDGVRLLRPETLALMTKNHLSPEQRASGEVGGMPLFVAGHGFGLGVAVVVEPERAAPTVCGGGRGSVGWPGGFGGWWQADPNDRSVAIFLAHNIVELEQMAQGVGLGVFGAIAQFQAYASGRGRH